MPVPSCHVQDTPAYFVRALRYQKLGFGHLSGGFDCGRKGYNPEDEGEWIMVRIAPPLRKQLLPQSGTQAGLFDANAYYTTAATVASGEDTTITGSWTPFRRSHYPEVCCVESSARRRHMTLSIALFHVRRVFCSMLMVASSHQTSYCAVELKAVCF